LLLSRSHQFRKAYGIGDLATVDGQGYFAFDPSYAEEIFDPEFFDLLETYFEKGGLPPKSVMVKEFKSKEILRLDSPLERRCFNRFPSLLATRKRGEFLKVVAECLLVCSDTLGRNRFRVMRGSRKFPERNSGKDGERLHIARERVTEPGGKLSTGQKRTPNKRIRVASQPNTDTRQQISEILEGVIRELLERTRKAETS
jgi:hypothetical protein